MTFSLQSLLPLEHILLLRQQTLLLDPLPLPDHLHLVRLTQPLQLEHLLLLHPHILHQPLLVALPPLNLSLDVCEFDGDFFDFLLGSEVLDGVCEGGVGDELLFEVGDSHHGHEEEVEVEGGGDGVLHVEVEEVLGEGGGEGEQGGVEGGRDGVQGGVPQGGEALVGGGGGGGREGGFVGLC